MRVARISKCFCLKPTQISICLAQASIITAKLQELKETSFPAGHHFQQAGCITLHQIENAQQKADDKNNS